MLEHQIRCHGDTSNVSIICQELLKHHYWSVLCDLVVCMINTGNKVISISVIMSVIVMVFVIGY